MINCLMKLLLIKNKRFTGSNFYQVLSPFISLILFLLGFYVMNPKGKKRGNEGEEVGDIILFSSIFLFFSFISLWFTMNHRNEKEEKVKENYTHDGDLFSFLWKPQDHTQEDVLGF